jgi:endogenous inhibitor of DNA gyrase (YacG/DUF329 family)
MEGAMANDRAPAVASSRCPTCRKPTAPEHRPFCSRRCADIDLARWLGGTFVIPGPALESADDSTLSAATSARDRPEGRDPDDEA